MGRMPRMCYLWPGLPQLWLRGSWLALAVAVTAAVLLNLALLTTFVWSELIVAGIRSALWVVLSAVWVAAAIFSKLTPWPAPVAESAGPRQDTFSQAMEQYLRGDYFQAERSLVGLLQRNHRDLDARLMLAALMRRTDRREEAENQLDVLVRIDGAEKWELEIRHEREQLADIAEEDERQEQPAADAVAEQSAAEMMRVA